LPGSRLRYRSLVSRRVVSFKFAQAPGASHYCELHTILWLTPEFLPKCLIESKLTSVLSIA
jgi:hypothetical protein